MREVFNGQVEYWGSAGPQIVRDRSDSLEENTSKRILICDRRNEWKDIKTAFDINGIFSEIHYPTIEKNYVQEYYYFDWHFF